MKRFLSAVLVCVMLVCMLPIGAFAADMQTTPMYRLYNPNSGEHFYTGSTQEKDNLVSVGWNYEGIAWNAPIKGGDPVYRLYNPNADCGSHHYTNSTEERDNLVSVGWILEGIGWFGATVSTRPPAEENPSEPAATLKINTPKNTVIWVGDTLQIDYTYTGKGTLTWSSELEGYLSVNNKGVVTGHSACTCAITVTDGTLSASLVIQVKEKSITAESIKIMASDAPLWDGVSKVAGNYMNIYVHVSPNEAPRGITVSSSNSSVVSVSSSDLSSNDKNVRLNFNGSGSATITITSEDGCASKSYTINVKSDYSCNPGSGLMSPEQWADTCTQVMVENGFTKNTSCGSYRVLTLTDSELTWSRAKSIGEACVHEWWADGCKYCWISYEGVDENGNHVFYTRWG